MCLKKYILIFHLFPDIFESFGGFSTGGGFPGFSQTGRSRGRGWPGSPSSTMEFEDVPFSGSRKQDPPIEHSLPVSLEDLLTGTKKKMKVSRRVLNPDGMSTSLEDRVLEINVKKGWKEGTKITFPKEGHQGKGKIPADIVFIIKDKPHNLFTRDKENNLIHKAKISLRDALTGGNIFVKTLDGRQISVPVFDIINPNTKRIIPGEGLPLPKTPTRRGDMIIQFDIAFPSRLDSRQKEALKEILPK